MIALLRDVTRTATVIVHSAFTVYELGWEPFVTEVLGHAPTWLRPDTIAAARLAVGAEPG